MRYERELAHLFDAATVSVLDHAIRRHELDGELQLAPRLPPDRVREDAVWSASLRVHADEQRCVAALLQEVDVLRPVILDDVFAPAIELVRNEGVEVPLPSGPVAVHHDDLGRSARARASYRCVDLLRVERTTLVVRALLL